HRGLRPRPHQARDHRPVPRRSRPLTAGTRLVRGAKPTVRTGPPAIREHPSALNPRVRVRVPGGALLIKALTWWFSPDRSRFHVYCGRLCAPCVLWSQRTVRAAGGLTGPNGTGQGSDPVSVLV